MSSSHDFPRGAGAAPGVPLPPAGRPHVAAYYFPNFHADPRNEIVHGKGWTEWDLLRCARPRFPGHRQPLVPAWGFEDESRPEVMARKIDAAARHGVDSFIFDWYHYDGEPFLNRALDEGFLAAPNRNDLTFCLMWANHDWADMFPAKRNQPSPVQFQGKVPAQAFRQITRLLCDRYFPQENHLRLDGAPVFSIYQMETFCESFGSEAAAARALEEFRRTAAAAGFPKVHLNAIAWDLGLLLGEADAKDPFQRAARLGFDSVMSYVWVHHVNINGGGAVSYGEVADRYFEMFGREKRKSPIPAFPNVTMGWDPSPRTVQSDVWEPGRYPFNPVLEGNTPAAFESALRQAFRLATESPAVPLVTLNAWNEWTEGSYLEPDTVHGFRYLEAVRRVFGLNPKAVAAAAPGSLASL